VGPFGLSNRTFDSDVIDLPIIIVALSLSVEVSIRTSGNCVDCAMGREGVGLLWGFLDLRWRWRRWVGFGLDLRVEID
jgi:hypothetical protein